VLRAPQARLSGAGGPGWRGGTGWPLGPGGDRAALRALASVPSRRVRPTGVATQIGAAPGADGAVAPARAGEPRPQSSGAVPVADEVVGGAVDLCPRAGGRADEQCVGTNAATGGAVAQGELRVGQ